MRERDRLDGGGGFDDEVRAWVEGDDGFDDPPEPSCPWTVRERMLAHAASGLFAGHLACVRAAGRSALGGRRQSFFLACGAGFQMAAILVLRRMS